LDGEIKEALIANQGKPVALIGKESCVHLNP